MYLGLVFPNGLILFKELIGKQNSEKFLELLKSFIVPAISLNTMKNPLIIMDNCRTHTAKNVQNYIKSADINVLDWPAVSPDLNIIENVFKMVEDKVYENGQPPNYYILRNRIENAIFDINTNRRETICQMFKNYSDRLFKVIEKKGNKIN